MFRTLIVAVAIGVGFVAPVGPLAHRPDHPVLEIVIRGSLNSPDVAEQLQRTTVMLTDPADPNSGGSGVAFRASNGSWWVWTAVPEVGD